METADSFTPNKVEHVQGFPNARPRHSTLTSARRTEPTVYINYAAGDRIAFPAAGR